MGKMFWSVYLTSFHGIESFPPSCQDFIFSTLGCFGKSSDKKSDYDTVLSHVFCKSKDVQEDRDFLKIQDFRIFISLFEKFSDFLLILKNEEGEPVLLKETSLVLHIESEFLANILSCKTFEECLKLTEFLRDKDYSLFQRFLEILAFLKSFESVQLICDDLSMSRFLMDFEKTRKCDEDYEAFETYCYMMYFVSLWCEVRGFKQSDFFKTLGGSDFQDFCFEVFQDFNFLLDDETKDV